jgi:hypothetical protein
LDKLRSMGTISIETAQSQGLWSASERARQSSACGLSKRVLLSHRNLVANMIQCEALFALSLADVVLAALPFSSRT